MRKKTRTVRSRRKQDSEGGFVAKVIKIVAFVGSIAAILAFGYMAYQDYGERESLKSQIDSSLRKADSLQKAGSFEEAIKEYGGILKVVSSKKFSDEYARTQNNLGAAYGGLAGVRDKKANLEKAIIAAITAGFINSGQLCCSPERFYVHHEIYDSFISLLLTLVRNVKVGPQKNEEEQDIGPLGSTRVVENIKEQFVDAVEKGAQILHGGDFQHFEGDCLPTCMPTVMTNCNHQMNIMINETFGPVIPIKTFKDEQEVLNLANDSQYGLTATLFGGSQNFVKKLQDSYGRIFHNSCFADPENDDVFLYWGGFGNSAWVWEWKGRNFITRKGPRFFVKEFSRQS